VNTSFHGTGFLVGAVLAVLALTVKSQVRRGTLS
jgi:hypothetical protein